MESHTLTFIELDEQIEAMPLHPSYGDSASRGERWGNGVAIVSGLLGLILGKVLPASDITLALLITLLVIELVALLVAAKTGLGGLNLRPSSERRELATVLDFDLPHDQALIAWLKHFPRERLEVMSAFATYRLDRFRGKLPLLTGGIEKFGVLPLAAALFIQFRTLQWPLPHSWLEVLLFGALIWMYWMSLLQIGARYRLELYDALLKRALSA